MCIGLGLSVMQTMLGLLMEQHFQLDSRVRPFSDRQLSCS